MLRKLKLLIIFTACTFSLKAQLFINEVSQGPSGSKEYVEFVVAGTPGCQAFTTFDLRGWIFDDNNGLFEVGTNAGITPGCFRFSNDPVWASVKIGTIILIYNNNDRNSLIPPDNLTGANCQFIVPINNTQLINSNTTSPSGTSPFNNLSSYAAVLFNSPTNIWQPLNNTSDTYCTVSPTYTLTSAVSWNTNTNAFVNFPGGGTAGRVMYMTNAVSNNSLLQANWTIQTVVGNETPGIPNNVANTTWISGMNNNCQPHIPLSVSFNSTAATCSYACDGSASIIASNGYGGYTYLWSNNPSQTSSTIAGLCQGTYTVTVTDTHNCSVLQNIIIDAPDTINAMADITNPVCTASNGSIVIHTSGGTQPYIFNWNTNPIQSDSIINQLAPGNYTVVITDLQNCVGTFNYSLNQVDSLIQFNASISNVLCNAGSTGSISVNPSNGSSPYSILWNTNPTQSGATISNLVSGNYLVTITDQNGCINDTTFLVLEPAALSANITTTDISCFNSNDGSANAIVNGGTAPYNFSWSTLPVQNNATANNLSEGFYTLIITDDNNCILNQTMTIQAPDSLYATAEITNSVCTASNGSIIVHPGGGVGPYSFLWNTNPTQTDTLLLNVVSGNYTITITDANNCIKNYSYDIIAIDSLLEITAAITDALCNGGSNGNIALSVSGGIAPISAIWNSNPFQTGLQLTNVNAGSYSVVVTDINGCTSDSTFQVNEPALLSVNVNTTDVSCYNGNNGSAQAIGLGGMAPYNFVWNTIPVQNGANAIGLIAASYNVTITDANNCSSSQTFQIQSPDSISVSAQTQQPVCTASNGSIILNTSGGTAPYSFLWNNASNSSFLNTIPQGSYSVMITDALNCQNTFSYNLNGIDSLISSNVVISDVLCFGGNTGTISVNPNGGLSPYSLVWNTTPAQSGTSISNLTAGNYSVTITDQNGCTTDTSIFVNQPLPLVILTGTEDVSCFGGTNGTAIAHVSGGTGPYFYSWNTNPVQTDSIAVNLLAGNYSISISDQNGCNLSSTVNIASPVALTANVITNDEICGQANGTANIIASGGTGSLSYSWSPNISSTNIANGLSSGNYSVIISDQNNCNNAINFIINNTGVYTINPVLINNVNCYDEDNGTATVQISGGLLPFSFSWSPTLTNNDTAYQLGAGIYIVTVTDANGCVTQDSVLVAEPSQLSVDAGPDQIICNGTNATISAQATGGTSGNYQYFWNSGQTTAGPFTVAPTQNTNYIVNVTDANGCISVNDTIIVSLSPPISANISINGNDSICVGNNVILNAIVSGSGNYNYSWSPSNGNNSSITVSPTSTTMYYLSVSDNCTSSNLDSVKITVLPLPNVLFSSTINEGCAPLSVNFINLSSASENCFWQFGNGQSSIECQPSFTFNDQGSYDVSLTVTNSFGCTNQFTDNSFINVASYPEALFSTSSDATDLLNPEINFYDQSLNAENWNWYINNSLSSTNQNFTNTFSDTGKYEIGLVVKNSFGCSDTSYKLIFIKEYFTFYLPNAFTPDDNIVNDIFIHKSSGLSKKDFEFLIFDRWGNEIFKTNDILQGWNGKYKGEICQEGVYVYKVKCRDISLSPYYFQGKVTLLR